MNSHDKTKKLTIEDELFVVGVGASAGGLEAIQTFFENVPNNTPLSFVVVQHLNPDYKSMMRRLLQPHTNLPITIVIDNLPIKSGNIYLIPTDNNIIIKENKFKLVSRNNSGSLNLPIDIFFESLAEEFQENAIGVLLSGTGSDGTRGVRKIKENKGLIFAQEPSQAMFDGMPISAINTGIIDAVLPVEAIPDRIYNFIEFNLLLNPKLSKAENSFYFKKILSYLYDKTGLDLTLYRNPTLVRRIIRRMNVGNFDKFNTYYDYLTESDEETKILYFEFLINVTRFFRDKPIWDSITSIYIPKILSKYKGGKNVNYQSNIIKIWCIGCSTGEEAYTIAILFMEAIEKLKLKVQLKIFATDINQKNIDFASAGVYPHSIVADLSSEYIAKYFSPRDDKYAVTPKLRKSIIFSVHDILKDPPFHRLDLVVCRNLLIYFKPEAQSRVTNILNGAVKKDGYVFLGSSESIGNNDGSFELLDKKVRIYQNTQPYKNTAGKNMPYGNAYLSYNADYFRRENKLKQEIEKSINEVLLDYFPLITILIDENAKILQARGQLKSIVELPETGFSDNLFKMLPSNISVLLRTAVRKVDITKNMISHKGVVIKQNGKEKLFDIIVKLTSNDNQNTLKRLLITFIPKEEIIPTKLNLTSDVTNNDIIKNLEEELSFTKNNLNTAVEELELNNEELQAANEELISSNEELQSTNEELQSVNEELHTVNVEHQQRIEEIVSLNEDMDNLLKSTQIGTVFLDRDLRIRKFTPAIKEQFNLRDSDLYRPLSHFTTNFTGDSYKLMFDNIQTALTQKTSLEQEITTLTNKIYLLKINPFISAEDEIKGVVLSFIDITRNRRIENSLADVNAKLDAILENSAVFITIFGLDGKVLYANSVVEGINKDEYIGDFVYNYVPNETWEIIQSNIKKVVETKSSTNYYIDYTGPTGELFCFVNEIAPIVNKKTGIMDSVVIITTDVTTIKRLEQNVRQKNSELRKTNKELEQFAYIASHDLQEPIRGIIGFTKRLKKQLASLDDKRTNNYLDYIEQSSQRMKDLISGLLTYSRVRRNIEFSTVDFNKIMDDVTKDLIVNIEEKKAKINYSKLPKINASENAIRMIFQNLVSNALKFAKENVPPVISIVAKEQKDNWLFKVEDNGIGIAKEHFSHIFQIFQRLHNHKDYAGSGIGLSLCKKNVELHRGKIWVESEEGKGSTFFFTVSKNIEDVQSDL